DPDLLTLKAARLLEDADVIFHDALVTDEVLSMARRDAERVYVGKRAKTHGDGRSTVQEHIHELMIEAARAGKRVVRLKGGDPFIFGRGGEELEALRAAGVEAHVVPGVSSALAGAAAAGAPLTHRTLAQSVTFVTGHAAAKNGEESEPALDWPALARPNQTVVVFMGVGTAGTIAGRLIDAGRAGSTPVAVVENATRANEIVARGQLSSLGALISENGIKGPAVLIIGEVAALADDAALTALSRRAA
ncbi:MAG: uroporphyrinogen-III C-methyltransferase, partial [Maricaulaceae bacterium]